MKLFIDGDAFPNLLKPILFRAIERLKLSTTVISNKQIYIGESTLIEYQIVSLGPDEADKHIVQQISAGDLAITSDIPLADQIITKLAHAMDHRGRIFTTENIKNHLAIRDLMQHIRESGQITKGPDPMGKKDVQSFANSFNNFLTIHHK